MEVEVYFCKIYSTASTTSHCLNRSIFQEPKSMENTYFSDSEIQVFQLLTFNPRKQHKDLKGNAVCFLSPQPISSLGWKTLHSKQWLIAGEVVPGSQKSQCFLSSERLKARQLNLESSPLKSLALSHLPAPPARPLFETIEDSEFSVMITRIEEGNCHLSKWPSKSRDQVCLHYVKYSIWEI